MTDSEQASRPRAPAPTGSLGGKGRGGPKRRVRNTCKACRDRKGQCSRGNPCEFCERRGIECDWSDARPAFEAHELPQPKRRMTTQTAGMKDDADAIFATLSRVMKMVEAFEDNDREPLGYRRYQDLPSVPLDDVDDDLATQLANMALSPALSGHVTLQEEPPRSAKGPIAQEVFRLLAVQAPGTHAPSEGMLGLGIGPNTISELIKALPSRNQAVHLFAEYNFYVAWMHRAIHEPTFHIQTQDFYSRHGDHVSCASDSDFRNELHWIASLFGVCGLAMYTSQMNAERATALSLPVVEGEKRALGHWWVRCAGSALILGDFMNNPTVEAVRAMLIMAQLPMWVSNGENLGAVLSFLGLGVNLATHARLDVDPDELDAYKNASDLTKQDRRRVMHAILGADWTMQSLLCKKWGLQHPSKFSVKLPLDVLDQDFDLATGALLRAPRTGNQETIFTSLNARSEVSRKWMELSIALNDPDHPPTHATILDFDRQFEALEASFPPCIRTKLLPLEGGLHPSPSTGNTGLAIDRLSVYGILAGAQLRLHRGFVSRRDGIPLQDIRRHRERVLYYGRLQLALQRSGLYSLDHVPMQYFVLSAAIALCVYDLTAEGDLSECDRVREEVRIACERISPHVPTSSILRRSHLMLQYLLHQATLRAGRANPDPDTERYEDAQPVGAEGSKIHHSHATQGPDRASNERTFSSTSPAHAGESGGFKNGVGCPPQYTQAYPGMPAGDASTSPSLGNIHNTFAITTTADVLASAPWVAPSFPLDIFPPGWDISQIDPTSAAGSTTSTPEAQNGSASRSAAEMLSSAPPSGGNIKAAGGSGSSMEAGWYPGGDDTSPEGAVAFGLQSFIGLPFVPPLDGRQENQNWSSGVPALSDEELLLWPQAPIAF